MNYELLIVALVLIVLTLLFFGVFIFTHRVEQTSYIGDLLRDNFYSAERQKRISEVEEAWNRGQYHRRVMADKDWLSRSENQLPEEASGDADSPAIKLAKKQLERNGRIGTLPPGLVPDDDNQTRSYLWKLRNWEDSKLGERAKVLFEKDIESCEAKANEAADKALRGLDFSTAMGRGPEFILRFTAVVTIVFVVLALGIVDQLDSQAAGAILAAIAGYVLGQGTSHGDPREKKSKRSSPPEKAKPSEKDLSNSGAS